jgi:hypothetical protein
VLGSLICLGLEFDEGEGDRDVKRAKKLPLFDMSTQLDGKIAVAKLRVGGMHSAILTPQGQVFTWGVNDEGALGRVGLEDKPCLVDLPSKVTDCTLGDSHSLFYNTANSSVFYCGLYRVRYFWIHPAFLVRSRRCSRRKGRAANSDWPGNLEKAPYQKDCQRSTPHVSTDSGRKNLFLGQ